jgi:PAS domain S-box-containing protein
MPLIHSLKRALTLNFLLLASVPMLLFGLLSIQLVSEQQLSGVRERNMAQARSVAGDVERFLQEVQSDLSLLQQTVGSGSILQPGAVDSFLDGVVRNSHFFESIYLLDAKLKVKNLGVLPELIPRRQDYAALDFSGHQLFRRGARPTAAVWSDTFVSLVTGEPSVTLAMPLGQGFLLGNIRLESLSKMLQRYATRADVEVAIVDRGGTLVAHNEAELARQRINYSIYPAVAGAIGGTETTDEFNHGSKHYLESAARIAVSGWVAWVGLDMEVVQLPIQHIRNLLIGFMLATVALAVILSLLNIRRLMRPLSALGENAGQIADGRYDFSFAPSGLAEIDTLGEQFSSMSQAIRQREESIVASEKRFRDLVNSIDGIVWEMEYPSMRFLFVSRQAETIFGYPIREWYGSADFWREKIPTDDRSQAEAYSRLMTEKQLDHDFEYRMLAVDGREVWIHNLVTVVVEDDRPVRLLGVMLDVTAQKELLDELSRSEQNYREIFDSTSDAIFVHDAQTGRIVDVNQAMLTMFECSYHDAVNSEVDRFSAGNPPFSTAEVKQHMLRACEQGSHAFEWYSRRATGELFWTEIHLRYATIGNQHRLLAAVRDISERKETAEKLRDLNARLQLLIDRMPLGCIVWTPEFTVSLWNPAAEEIFGFTADEMVGRQPYGSIVAENVRPLVEPLWARLMMGDETAHGINENMTRHGRTIVCEWFNTPILGEDGQPTSVISMVQDISARVASDKELAEYRTQLEELVRDRTRQLELAQQELVQKERLSVLGQLTATVSHEIRNPLGTVANALFLLRELLAQRPTEEFERPLRLAERNVDRCDSIISELLDFSRQREVIKKPLQLDPWLAEVLDEIACPEGVVCRWQLTSGATLQADAERLRRVMVNAITNATQALEEVEHGEKRIEVISRNVGDRCEILVKDTGPGMSEEVKARIFEPMFSTKNFGVGLGVPIIKNIIEDHGGGVEYLSAPGEGTTLRLWLPLNGGHDGFSAATS